MYFPFSKKHTPPGQNEPIMALEKGCTHGTSKHTSMIIRLLTTTPCNCNTVCLYIPTRTSAHKWIHMCWCCNNTTHKPSNTWNVINYASSHRGIKLTVVKAKSNSYMNERAHTHTHTQRIEHSVILKWWYIQSYSIKISTNYHTLQMLDGKNMTDKMAPQYFIASQSRLIPLTFLINKSITSTVICTYMAVFVQMNASLSLLTVNLYEIWRKSAKIIKMGLKSVRTIGKLQKTIGKLQKTIGKLQKTIGNRFVLNIRLKNYRIGSEQTWEKLIWSKLITIKKIGIWLEANQ